MLIKLTTQKHRSNERVKTENESEKIIPPFLKSFLVYFLESVTKIDGRRFRSNCIISNLKVNSCSCDLNWKKNLAAEKAN